MESSWLWPDAILLEALHKELGAIEDGLVTARHAALESQHGSAEELAEVEKRVQQRASSDGEVCTALAAMSRELSDEVDEANSATVAAIRKSKAFADLDRVLPVPPGVLKDRALLTKFVAAQQQRRTTEAVRAAELKAVRKEQEADVDLCPSMVRARSAADAATAAAIEARKKALIWSDHRPIRSILRLGDQEEQQVLAWNVLERRLDGIRPVLPVLPFYCRTGEEKKCTKSKKNETANLQRAMLDCCVVEAHAEAVAAWAMSGLLERGAAAVCLSEVGAPVVAALKRAQEKHALRGTAPPVMSVSAPTSSSSSSAGGDSSVKGHSLEARTIVLAREGSEPQEDVHVEVGGKTRHFACMRLRAPRTQPWKSRDAGAVARVTCGAEASEEEDGAASQMGVAEDLAVVAVHVLRRPSSDSRCPQAGGGLAAAGEALRELRDRLKCSVLAVGDWNGNVMTLPATLEGGDGQGGKTDCAYASALPNTPTTYADAVDYPQSKGIDGAFVLPVPVKARSLAVQVMLDVD